MQKLHKLQFETYFVCLDSSLYHAAVRHHDRWAEYRPDTVLTGVKNGKGSPFFSHSSNTILMSSPQATRILFLVTCQSQDRSLTGHPSDLRPSSFDLTEHLFH